jgi:hypothetical protein
VKAATALKQLRITDKLHILEPREQSLFSVPDPHSKLYPTHTRVFKIMSDGFRCGRVESTVSVHQADDHVFARTAPQDIKACEVLQRRIEGRAFTLLSLG